MRGSYPDVNAYLHTKKTGVQEPNDFIEIGRKEKGRRGG